MESVRWRGWPRSAGAWRWLVECVGASATASIMVIACGQGLDTSPPGSGGDHHNSGPAYLVTSNYSSFNLSIARMDSDTGALEWLVNLPGPTSSVAMRQLQTDSHGNILAISNEGAAGYLSMWRMKRRTGAIERSADWNDTFHGAGFDEAFGFIYAILPDAATRKLTHRSYDRRGGTLGTPSAGYNFASVAPSGIVLRNPTNDVFYFVGALAEDVWSFTVGASGPSVPVSSGSGSIARYSGVMSPSGSYLYVQEASNVKAHLVTATTLSNPAAGTVTWGAGSVVSLIMDPQGRSLYLGVNDSVDKIVKVTLNASGFGTTGVNAYTFAPSDDVRKGVIDPSGKYLYISTCAAGNNLIQVFSISPVDGSLSLATSTPMPVGADCAEELAIVPKG